MPIQDLGGEMENFLSAGSYGNMTGTVLSDGTIVVSVFDTATTVAIRYSNDGGETWTQCSTKITVGNGQWFNALTADEFDYLYVRCHSGATNTQVVALSFDGDDVTVLDTEAMDTGARYSRANLVAFDNPTRSGDHTYVAVAGQDALAKLWSVDFNRGTELFDSGTFFQVVSTSSIAAGSVTVLLENTVEDSRVAAAPSSPVGALVFRQATTTLYGYPLIWSGSNHRWQPDTPSSKTISANTDGNPDAIYDPTVDRIIVVNGESATVAGVVTGDMPLTAWTERTDLSFASGPKKGETVAVTTDGLGDIRAIHLEQEDSANQDLSEHIWNDATPVFGSESVVSSAEDLEGYQGIGTISAWSPGGRLFAYIWCEDESPNPQPRIYTVWTAGVGGGGWGFGFIPIGVA